jgi:hypothetical protein
MRRILGYLAPGLIILLLLLLIFGIGFALVVAVALGAGWLLRLFLPFSLFEATLLGALFAVLTIYFVFWVFRNFGPPMAFQLGDVEEDEREIASRAYKTIPTTRFYKTPAERTWTAWLRYELANDIYAEFQDAPHTLSNMNDRQLQELAIRLADMTLSLLKRKTARTKNLNVTLGALRQEMQRQGQRAYDDDILRLALNAIHLNTDFYQAELLDLIREGGWDDPANVPEREEEP